MNKVDILTQITENTKLMQAIEELVDIMECPTDEFVQNRMKEWHELRRTNGELVKKYEIMSGDYDNDPRCSTCNWELTICQCNDKPSFDELNIVLHSIKEKVEKGGLL